MESLNYRNASAPREEPVRTDSAAEESGVDRMMSNLKAYFRQRPELNCLVVIDPSRAGLPESLEETTAVADLPHAVVTVAHEAYPDEHRPYLVQLDLGTSVGMEWLAESVRLAFEDRHPESVAQGLGQRIGGWLATSSPADAVAAHWSQHVLQTDDRGRQCALRFYDSRALGLLWPMLLSEQRQALLGPVSAWHAIDACARPCIYTNKTRAASSLGLTGEQWRSIHRHGLINRALGIHMLNTGRQPEPHDVEAAVASAARADQYGLVDRDDKVAFIGHSLAWHPQFDRHPKVQRALRQMNPDDFYTAAVGELGEDEIEEIRRGDWANEKSLAVTTR